MKTIEKFFLKRDGHKQTYDRGKLAIVAVSLFLIGGSVLFVDFVTVPDTSVLSIRGVEATASPPPLPPAARALNSANVERPRRVRQRGKRERPIRYSARQVLSRHESIGVGLPVGTRFAGVLVTGIDTRFPGQMIRAVLPEGAHWKGERRLDKDTSLLGTFHHSGVNDRVFLRFTRGVTPEGQEFAIAAQALDAGDSSPGVAGVFHGNADGRIASTLGLSMATGAADALTRVDHHGAYSEATVRSTLRDALLHGATRAGEAEVKRRMDKIARSPEYVTVAAGTKLTVMLTESWRGHGRKK